MWDDDHEHEFVMCCLNAHCLRIWSSGKPLKSLPDLLREYNLPPGLFPQNITCYELDEARSKLIVHMSSPCEVCFKDSSIVRYSTRVKATLSRGKLTGIEGMKTKVLVWVKVTSINVEGFKSDKVWFTAGVKKWRSKDAYEMVRDALRVEEFWNAECVFMSISFHITHSVESANSFVCLERKKQ